MITVNGKGGKQRSIPIEAPLLQVIDTYAGSRIQRFPATVKRNASNTSALAALPAQPPQFIGRDGERITRGTVQ